MDTWDVPLADLLQVGNSGLRQRAIRALADADLQTPAFVMIWLCPRCSSIRPGSMSRARAKVVRIRTFSPVPPALPVTCSACTRSMRG